MTAIMQWWQTLEPVNQWFYIAATFFGVFFIWQMIGAFMGLGSQDDLDVDTHVDPSAAHHTPDDAQDSVMAFKLISIRSVVAFFTLFSWAGALYMSSGTAPLRATLYGLLWGLAGMLAVAGIVHGMRRMTETGNLRLATCVGAVGTVYLDIPGAGQGEVRMLCSGVMTHLKARAAGSGGLKAGTRVRVERLIGADMIEVRPETADSSQTGGAQ